MITPRVPFRGHLGDGEIRDRLTEVAVVMNDLVDRVPEFHERTLEAAGGGR